MVTRGAVNPDVLRWARESMGFDLEDAARKARVKPARLRDAEAGKAQLTLRQAQALAGAYRRPLAALFLPEPPDEPVPDSQFRQFPGMPPPPWPAEMRVLAREVWDRQAAARDLYDLLEIEPPWLRLPDLPIRSPAEELAEVLRELMGVPLVEQLAWRDRAGFAPLRAWIDAVERLGAIVIQDSSVSLSVVRGFVAPDDRVPAIVVNTSDDPRSRAFTLIHELGHLLRFGLVRADEPYCNALAAAILMPGDDFARYYKAARELRDALAAIDETALAFGVTPAATVVRVESLRLDSQSVLAQVRSAIEQRGAPRRTPGGNYYRNVIAWYGPAYIDLVFSAVDAGRLSTLQAARVLGGVKVPNHERLRQELAERAIR